MSLNSDELGRKGQARFAEICSDAKLIRNPSTEQDRTGWDFFVEFDHEPLDKNTTLDKRLSPISTHIQIKTIWSTSDRFKMRLSAAERLAKEPKPTFIYVFKVNNKLEYVSAYLVHMLDQNLFAVLKRLRREQVLGTKRINKKFISFRASVCGQKIEPTGEAFRQAVFHACGADIDAYMAKKREQIKSLGFEPGAFLATTRLKADGYSGFVDALLGLKPIEVTGGEAFETRFGIKLKLAEPHIGRGTMQIKPERADRCTISFRESKLSVPATFEADIILPPLKNIPKEHLKFLIKSRLFRFFVTSEKIQFSTDQEEIRTATLKIDEWIPFYRMLIALCHGADITVVPDDLHP